MKYCARTFSIFLFISFISAQTYVPDDNFEQALIDLGYDDVLDDYVVTDSINTVTTLNVENDSISDLTGIEGFTALTNLNCSYNQLTSLDMSSNTALTEMNCARNDLTSLDVSSNTALTELNCHSNQLTSLDVSNNTALTEMNCAINDLTSLDVSSNTALTDLRCYSNNLTSLDVSNNTALTDLRCYSNNLTSLDVSNNTALTEMRCARNELTSLDVSSNTALTHLSCNDNQLTSLDVSSNTALTRLYCYTNQLDSLDVSSNTELTKLICGNNSLASLDLSNNADLTELHLGVNQLTSLDVSSNTALTRLTCNGNQLTYLNMKNGVTDGLTNFNVTNNDSLDCIETLDPTYATENWTYANGNIDEGVSFSQNCLNPAGYTYVPDDNFEQALIDLGYDDVLDDYVITDSINTVTTLNVSNDSISDLTGIEDFIALTYLFCAQNQLTSLNMSSNTALTHLYCANNDLTSIDVINNTSLLVIHCHYNDLTSLDLSENILLTNLEAWNNNLASLDVSNNIALSVLNLHHNDLTSMDISSNTALTDLNINHNDMESLDVSQNTELTKLYVGSNSLTSLDVSANTALDDFRCYNNQLTSLDVSNNTLLTYLHTGTNQLTDLDVSQNTELTTMYVGSNSLTSLDVSSNTALTNLYCKENQLTSLDVRANIALAILNCSNNDLTNLDVSSNTALTHLVCNETQLTSLDLSNNTALTYLHSAENQLTSLDVSSNTALTDLHFSENQITILDVSNNTLLTLLSCADNQLTSLDVSNNTALAHIDCHENQLTSLDVSNNTSLTWLQCYGNQLTYLNMKNGITDILTTFNATNNDSLECIEILDPTYATENWTYADGNIDEGVTFAINCIPFIGPVWHVSTEGSDLTGNGSEESPFATIQKGIDFADDMDTVSVAAGTYVENIYINQDISIISISGEDSTIIDGNQSGTVLTINGDSLEIVLSGFTISNGNGVNAGGIHISSNNHNIHLSDLLVDSNISDCDYYCSGNGGGISIYGNQGVSLLEKVVVSNNISRGEMGYVGFGGGIYIGDQLITSLKEVSIINNSQTSYGDDSGGGGLYVGYETDITMEDCIISNNSTYESSNDEGYGGGIYVSSSNNVIMNNVIIENNNSNSSGGGFAWSTNGWSNEAPFDSIKMTNVVFRGNYSGDNGGGIYINGGRVIAHLDSVSIISNSVGNEGAGLHVEGSFADNPEHRPMIIGNEILISNNIATFRYGGGINVNNSKFYLNATSIVDNSISLEDDPVIRGGAITVRGDYLFEIENSIVWGNSNPAIYHYNVTADSLNVNYSNIQDGWEGEGNIDADPLFCSSNSSLSFDGVDDYVDAGEVTSNFSTADFTIEAWLKTTSTNGQSILVKNNGDEIWEEGEKAFYIDAGGHPTFVGYGNDFIISNTPINDGIWHHVVVVWDYSGSGNTGEGKMYVDGVDCSDNVTYAANYEDVVGNHITIGAPNYETTEAPNYFFGQIDEVAIWNNALAAAEITELYNSGSGLSASANSGNYTSSSNLLAYWDFNEGSGSTVVDQTSNGNDGMVHSATWMNSGVVLSGGNVNYTLAENSPCVGSGENNANMGALDVGCGPYNFSPTDFSLIEPSNNSEIMIDASNVDNGSITFSWEESTDANDDVLTYVLRTTSDEIGNYDYDISATNFSVLYADVIEDMTENNVTLAMIEWTVHVTDGINTIEASNAPFTITIDGGWAMNASAEALIPEVFALHQNYPNPFNPSTSLRYDLPENNLVNITIYDMMGREVKTLVNQTQDAGYKSIIWNATNDYGKPVSAGIYLYQIQAGEYIQTKKMVLLK